MRLMKNLYMIGSGQIRLSNPLDCHIYLVDCGENLVLVDAGSGVEPEMIVRNIQHEGYDPDKITHILLTHCHGDHAGGCAYLKDLLNCKVVCTRMEGRLLKSGSQEEMGLNIAKRSGIYPQDYEFTPCRPDVIVKDGEAISIGERTFKVVVVRGHSWEPACYLTEIDGTRILFSSDVVFYGGTIGLGNWPGSSLSEYRRSIGRLSNLEVDVLLPGHFLWTLKDGQSHLNKAIENLKSAWVPPAWQHMHPHR